MSQNPYYDTYYVVGLSQYLAGAAVAGVFVALTWWIILQLRPQRHRRIATVTIAAYVMGIILTIGPIVALRRFATPINERELFAALDLVSALGAAATTLALVSTLTMLVWTLAARFIRRP